MSWHSQPRKRKKGKVGRKPRKEKERGKGRGSGDSREFGSNKKGSGASRGQKRINQRYNRRFFGVLPEPRSTGETTRTKTDGSLSSEISDSGNERNNKRGIGSHTRWGKNQQRKKKRRSARSLEVQLEWCVVTLGGNAGVER